MYAVVKTGGKQYRVSKGDKLKIEKLPAKVGEEVQFSEVLLIGGADSLKIGTPVVADAKVTARVLEQDRSKKVLVFKFKRRKGYKKLIGHRQDYTRVEITDIQTGS